MIYVLKKGVASAEFTRNAGRGSAGSPQGICGLQNLARKNTAVPHRPAPRSPPPKKDSSTAPKEYAAGASGAEADAVGLAGMDAPRVELGVEVPMLLVEGKVVGEGDSALQLDAPGVEVFPGGHCVQ
jgi:hypothetical protein